MNHFSGYSPNRSAHNVQELALAVLLKKVSDLGGQPALADLTTELATAGYTLPEIQRTIQRSLDLRKLQLGPEMEIRIVAPDEEAA